MITTRCLAADVRFWQILLQKYFWGDGLKF